MEKNIVIIREADNPTEIANQDSQDNAFLASLGYKPEFKRNFTPIEIFGIAFSTIGLVPSITSTLLFSIPYGGAPAMVWGWMTGAAFIMIVALALAELGSAVPTSGGLYYWTYMYSPSNWRHFSAWIVAYCNTIGNIAAFAAGNWGCAVQVMAAATIGSGLDFQSTPSRTFAVYCILLTTQALICSVSPVVVARSQVPCIIVNVLLCFTFIVVLPIVTPRELKNDADYVFRHFTNLSNWPSGCAFMLSLLSPLWTISGYHSTIHVSEEARNARTTVPYGIVFAVFFSAVFGWGVIVTVAFCMGTDLQSIVKSPVGQPMAAILFNSLGKRGTLALWSFIVINQFAMGINAMTSASRQVFAFARDGGLPFSGWIYHISPRTHAPVHSVMFTAMASVLLGLLAFSGPNAAGAIFSLGIIAHNAAYAIPIAFRVLRGHDTEPGPFYLGPFSRPVAITAVIWMAFMSVVLFLPANPRPGPQDMNYAVVVFGAVLMLATIYFYFPKYGGRYWFKGPVKTIDSVQ